MYRYLVTLDYWTGPAGQRKREHASVEVSAANMPRAVIAVRAKLPADHKLVGKSITRCLGAA
jgi:hypothetical protein